MEYRYRSVKCPNCGKVSERSVNKHNYDSPFRICPYCQSTYFDGYYKEKGIEVFNDKGSIIDASAVIGAILTNGGAGVLIHLLFTEKFETMLVIALVFIGGLALLIDAGIIMSIKSVIHKDEYHQKQIALLEGNDSNQDEVLFASMKRLSSLSYLDALKAHGVEVPDYFYQRLQKR